MERVITYASPDYSAEQIEEFVSDVMAEVKRRSSRAGALYPFASGLRGIQRRGVRAEVELLYVFLALCSLVPSFRRNRTGFEPGKAFERVAAHALTSFTAGQSVVFADIPENGVRARIKDLGRQTPRPHI